MENKRIDPDIELLLSGTYINSRVHEAVDDIVKDLIEKGIVEPDKKEEGSHDQQ